MGMSWQHILIFLVIALLLFGRGKISELMGDVAKGIKAFKKGMNEDEATAASEPVPPPAAPVPPVPPHAVTPPAAPQPAPHSSEQKVG